MAAPRKENIKEIILETASRLLMHENVSKLTLASIAHEAGISKGTLYYHYKLREDLLFDLADKYFNEQYQELFVWTNNTNKDTSFPRLFKYILERDIHDPAIRLQMLYSASSGNEPLRKKILERYKQFQEAICQLIQERLPQSDASYLSWLALLVSDGMIIQIQIGNPLFDAKKFIQSSETMFRKINASLINNR